MTPLTVEVDLVGHGRRPLGDPLGRRLRGGDHVDLGAGQELGQRDRDVAGARRQVDQQVVGVVPVHVGEELLERLVQHRAPPDDGLVLLRRRSPWRCSARRGRRAAPACESITTGGRSTPSMPRDGEAPHVGVDDGHAVAPLGERHRQVRRDRRLADAALARRDEQARGCATTGRRTGSPGPRRGRGPLADPAVAAGSPCSCWRSAARSSSVITVKSRSTASTPASAVTAP